MAVLPKEWDPGFSWNEGMLDFSVGGKYPMSNPVNANLNFIRFLFIAQSRGNKA